jgi:hypothetical protein
MENPYDLFLALLASKQWGGVMIPCSFAYQFRNALLESIDENHASYPDHRYVTGQINSEKFRKTIEQLLDPVLPHLERQYNKSLGADLDRDELPLLVRTGQSLQLARCGDAKRSDAYFRTFEPEYIGIKERFETTFKTHCGQAVVR